MPRPKAILQSEFPYHVTARCINREWFKVPMGQVWEIFCRQLTFISRTFEVKIHSFVLMNNHFHLLVTTPQSNLDKVMANFMKETSRYLNKKSNRINQAWGARHFRSIIHTHHYFLHTYKYIYRNPVESGLSASCEEYQYSSLNFLLGASKVGFPMTEDLTLFEDLDRTLQWLNKKPPQEDWLAIENALKKSKFKIAKNKNSKRESRLEFDYL